MLNNTVKISDIKRTKKGYNALFINDEFMFSVDDIALNDYKITIGSCFTQQELSCILKASVMSKATNKCFDYLSRRMHSKKELYIKLLKYFDELTAQKAVEKMQDLGYIDDEAFCNMMMRHLLNDKKASINLAKQKLYQLGVDKEIIENTLVNFNGNTQIENIKTLLLRKYKNKLSQKEKVVQSLLRKGFSISDIKSAFKLIEEEIDFEIYE